MGISTFWLYKKIGGKFLMKIYRVSPLTTLNKMANKNGGVPVKKND
jgi:hypothetical protein